MVVPVAVVCRMPVAVVHVVDVVGVGHRDMTAALAVRMGVVGVLMVTAALALVRVPCVPTVQMTVVHVVDVIVVRDRHVPAAFAVHVLMSGVRPVLKGCCHATHLHRFGPLYRRSGDGWLLFGISTPARKNAPYDTHPQTSYRP